MQSETHVLELVTPAFLGGAKDTAEWRATSFRGQLRWWFRALAGARHGGDAEAVRRAEERIFGSTDRRSSLRLRVLAGESQASRDAAPLIKDQTAADLLRAAGESPEAERRLHLGHRANGKEITSNPLHYLAVGPIFQGQLNRPYLAPALKAATVEVSWRRPLPPDAERDLFDLAWSAWLHLGGIGARNRKGWGSLQQGAARPSRAAFLATVHEIRAVGEGFTGRPEWTHLSRESRVFVAQKTASSWSEALAQMGSWLMAFRRRYGARFDERPALQGRDYEWAARNGTLRGRGIPDRAGFGLPLPFFQGDDVTWVAGRSDPGTARRASPLLLHVAHLDDGFLPVLTHLPARFLPVGAELALNRGTPPADPTHRQVRRDQLDIVTRFLGGLQTRRLLEEVR